MFQKDATFQVLIGNDSNRLRAITLEASEVLGLVTGQIIGIDRQQESMASVYVVIIVALNLSI